MAAMIPPRNPLMVLIVVACERVLGLFSREGTQRGKAARRVLGESRESFLLSVSCCPLFSWSLKTRYAVGMKLRAILKLIRVPNLPTAAADVLAGFFVTLGPAYEVFLRAGNRDDMLKAWGVLILAIAAGKLVYSFGMAHNDLTHERKDRLLAKPRPLVAGEVSRPQVFSLTVMLALGAIACAAASGWVAAGTPSAALMGAIPALVIVGLSMFYNFLAAGRVTESGYIEPTRASNVSGALLLGVCRVANVFMGVQGAALLLSSWGGAGLADSVAIIRLVPVLLLATVFVHFVAVTSISLLEDFGGGRKGIAAAGFVLVSVPWIAPIWLATGGLSATAGEVSRSIAWLPLELVTSPSDLGFGTIATPRTTAIADAYAAQAATTGLQTAGCVALGLLAFQSIIMLLRLAIAFRNPSPPMVGQCVRWGIITHTLGMGAWIALACGDKGMVPGMAVAGLFFVCLMLGKLGRST